VNQKTRQDIGSLGPPGSVFTRVACSTGTASATCRCGAWQCHSPELRYAVCYATCVSSSQEPSWEPQETEKGQKTNMQKPGVRWAGCSGGDTPLPPPPPASLLYTAANKEAEQHAFCSLLFGSWGLCPSQPADYLTWLCSGQVLVRISWSAVHTRPVWKMRCTKKNIKYL
jgi:hypothetical protein